MREVTSAVKGIRAISKRVFVIIFIFAFFLKIVWSSPDI